MGFERWMRVLRLRLRSVFFRGQVDRELDDELAYHVDKLIDGYIARGLTPYDARREALAAMDGLQQRREECQDMRRVRFIEELVEDVKYAGRQFRKNPGFTLVVTLVLALAIGGNTAIFSVARSVLTPLAIPGADRVVMVWTEAPARNWHQFPASMPDMRDWQASGIFSSLGAFVEDGFNLRLADRTDRVEGLRITSDLFQVLSVPAARGRLLVGDDDATGHPVVINDRLWRATFNGNPGIVGQTVILDGTLHTIVGVLPPDFPQFGRADLITLLPPEARLAAERGDRHFGVIGRLRDGLSFAAAGQRMKEVSLDLAKQYPQYDGGLVATLQPVQEAFVQDAQLIVWLLMGAVICALGVACANVASLLLAKGLARGREMAIRTALGGGRWRLTRQLLTEHLLLGVMSGLISAIPAWWGVRFITSYRLEELEHANAAGLDPPVLAFTFAVALATGALCGIMPASLVWKREVNAVLKGGPNVAAGRPQHRVRSLFVIGQIVLTTVLLVGGALMLRSFLHVLAESPGYNPKNVLTSRMALSETQYRLPERQVAFFERIVERAAALPGVVAASATEELPTSDDVHGSGMIFQGQPEPRPEDIPIAIHTAVLAGYFRAMEIPLVAGRYFSRADAKDSTPVVVIDEWTARHYWPNQNPIGQQLKLGRSQPWREIIGVVGSVEAPIIVRFLKGRLGQVYLPLAQDSRPRMTLVLRSEGDANALIAPMRAIVREVDPDQPVFRVQTLDDVRASGRNVVRLVTSVLTAFALMALLLAMIGLYGTMAYDVGQRTREFGLRMSLGAQPSSLLAMVLRQGSWLLGIGAGIGLVGALLSVRMMASLLYGIQAGDPLTFIMAGLLLAVSGLLATYVPARRATKVDPVVALRCE